MATEEKITETEAEAAEQITSATPASAVAAGRAASESRIGIGELMDKRARLEAAIDSVGLMIKNLKDKRTLLEKEIEDESVDIKNLKEKLQKVSEYIEEESAGIVDLARKREEVEAEADEVSALITSLSNRLSGIDRIIDEEGDRVKKIKSAKESSAEMATSLTTDRFMS